MSSTKANPSPLGDLGKLPAELRNEIYRLAITTTNPIELARSRIRNPALDRPLYAKRSYPPSKCIFVCKSKVAVTQGRRMRKPPTAQVLGINLLHTSSAVRNEATSMLYGANVFHFDNTEVLEEFAMNVGKRFGTITSVSVGVLGARSTQKKLVCLARLATPQLIELRISVHPDREEYTLGPCTYAKDAWRSIKPLVAVENVNDGHGGPTLAVALPEELTLRRLEAFRFAIDDKIEFDTEGVVGEYTAAVPDPEERSKRFKLLVIDYFKNLMRRKAEEAKDLERRKQGVIADMLSSPRSFRPSAQASRVAVKGLADTDD